MSKTKPFNISKKEVITAWERVKQNKGAYGVDRESIKDFELNLKDNLYKLWNRMSSGTYFPPAVRAVEIPKSRWKEADVRHTYCNGSHSPRSSKKLFGSNSRAEI